MHSPVACNSPHGPHDSDACVCDVAKGRGVCEPLLAAPHPRTPALPVTGCSIFAQGPAAAGRKELEPPTRTWAGPTNGAGHEARLEGARVIWITHNSVRQYSAVS